MAILKPDYTFNANGVTVNVKIIPDGTRWKSASKASAAGFSANALYKKERKLTDNTGKALTVTIHNTNDLDNVHDDGEQYVRATYNENMGSVRVHFYVDDVCAWQEMRAGTGMSPDDPVGAAEVSWHAGDGSVADGGNMTSISIEVIMNDNAEHDAKAYDNAARLTAWLLERHGLSVADVVSHTYWVNKSAGKKFADVDEQCTNKVAGKKWCPAYIFNSNNEETARKNWKAFKARIAEYLGGKKAEETEASDILYCVQVGAFRVRANADAMAARLKAAGFDNYITVKGEGEKAPAGAENKTEETPTPAAPKPEEKKIKAGDHVKVKDGAKVYGKTYKFAYWVYPKTWIVAEDPVGDRAVINKSADGENAINSPVNVGDLTLV